VLGVASGVVEHESTSAVLEPHAFHASVRSVVIEADRDDVVQATWLAALERPPPARFRFPAWLTRVAHRIAGRMNRTTARRAMRERAAASIELLAPTVDSVAHAESLRAITEAVLALDEPYRSTLLQRYYEDLAPQEIARRGVPRCCRAWWAAAGTRATEGAD
jgi:DNA-directed RNA polymerase specialized sigma24 family protein